MLIGKLLSPIHSLGPGTRAGLWTQGCNKNCKGCISPELKSKNPKKDIPMELLTGILRSGAKRNNCDRLTISGGDPFEQPEELCRLLKEIRKDFKDILVYTGFLYEQIADGSLGEAARESLEYIDVLIDGPYIEEQNVPEAVLRGSKNQRIIYLNPDRRDEYEDYLKQGRQLENFVHNNEVCTVGILNKEETP